MLVVRIAKNHPLLDGNKRLAWQSLTVFCALNGYELVATADDAVNAVLAIASGELDEPAVARWLESRLRPATPDE